MNKTKKTVRATRRGLIAQCVIHKGDVVYLENPRNLPIAGTYTISMGGKTTAPLAFNASPRQQRAAIKKAGL